jgi:hypothetical protein
MRIEKFITLVCLLLISMVTILSTADAKDKK